jgi:hypothetical protein
MVNGHLAIRLAALIAPLDVELAYPRIKPYRNVRISGRVVEPVAAALVAVFFEFAADQTERNVVDYCAMLSTTEPSSALLTMVGFRALTLEDPGANPASWAFV